MDQHVGVIPLMGLRGRITDRNGRVLATSLALIAPCQAAIIDSEPLNNSQLTADGFAEPG